MKLTIPVRSAGLWLSASAWAQLLARRRRSWAAATCALGRLHLDSRGTDFFLIFNFSILRKINTHIKNANLDAYTGG
jgi:hypothetical protein